MRPLGKNDIYCSATFQPFLITSEMNNPTGWLFSFLWRFVRVPILRKQLKLFYFSSNLRKPLWCSWIRSNSVLVFEPQCKPCPISKPYKGPSSNPLAFYCTFIPIVKTDSLFFSSFFRFKPSLNCILLIEILTWVYICKAFCFSSLTCDSSFVSWPNICLLDILSPICLRRLTTWSLCIRSSKVPKLMLPNFSST